MKSGMMSLDTSIRQLTEPKATDGMNGIFKVTLPPRMRVSLAISFDWTDTTFGITDQMLHQGTNNRITENKALAYRRERDDARCIANEQSVVLVVEHGHSTEVA